jgi:hypothetical protein
LLLACAAAIVCSLIARDSHLQGERAIFYFFDTHDTNGTLKLIDESKPLNPDYRQAITEARLTKSPGGVAILQRALRREPENGELWLRLSQQQVLAGDRAGAKRSYARARTLAPRFLPPTGPPPGT